jgi:hypothetical protein
MHTAQPAMPPTTPPGPRGAAAAEPQDTLPMVYRSEAFAEDLGDEYRQPSALPFMLAL